MASFRGNRATASSSNSTTAVFSFGPKETADSYEVFVENFERVAEDERFAAADGEPLRAERPFYPILLSAYGYENVFGYAGDLVGRLDGGDVTAPTGEERSARADGRNR